MIYLALKIGDYTINPPAGVPTGGISSLNNLISLVTNLLFIAAIVISLFYLIWGGFDWIFSGGDKQKLANARNKVIYAVVGLIIVFLAIFIVNLLYTFFKITPSGSGLLGV